MCKARDCTNAPLDIYVYMCIYMYTYKFVCIFRHMYIDYSFPFDSGYWFKAKGKEYKTCPRINVPVTVPLVKLKLKLKYKNL